LFTPPEHRNHGYASALLKDVIIELFEAEYERCGILSDATNKMFVEIGFQVVAFNLDIIV